MKENEKIISKMVKEKKYERMELSIMEEFTLENLLTIYVTDSVSSYDLMENHMPEDE